MSFVQISQITFFCRFFILPAVRISPVNFGYKLAIVIFGIFRAAFFFGIIQFFDIIR